MHQLKQSSGLTMSVDIKYDMLKQNGANIPDAQVEECLPNIV